MSKIKRKDYQKGSRLQSCLAEIKKNKSRINKTLTNLKGRANELFEN